MFDRIDRIGKASPTIGPFGETTARPGSIGARLADEFVGDVIEERRMRQVAELLTAPDSVTLIEQIATSADPRETLRTLVVGLSLVDASRDAVRDRSP